MPINIIIFGNMINGLKLFGLYLNMLGNVFSRPENTKVYLRRILDEMVKLGVNSLTIVSIISLFMGASTRIYITYFNEFEPSSFRYF